MKQSIDIIPQSVYKILTIHPVSDHKCDYHKSIKVRTFCCTKTNALFFAKTLQEEFNPFSEENFLTHQNWDKNES